MHYIEGGWPGSNPKDEEFFSRARDELGEATFDKIVAFGSTRRKHTACEDDNQVVKLAAAGTRAVCLVGKSWDLHIDKILCVSREENLAMVSETVAYFKAREREVSWVGLGCKVERRIHRLRHNFFALPRKHLPPATTC